MSQNSINTIWLNETYKRFTNSTNSAIHLSFCNIDPNLITFRDSSRCLNYINSLEENGNKVILLISYDVFPQPIDNLLQVCEQLNQIDSIYILYSSQLNVIELADNIPKCRGIYANAETLCSELLQLPYIRNKHQENFVYEDFTINVLPPTYIPTFNISDSRLLPIKSNDRTKHQEAEFMYSTLLREILITIESTHEEMINFCREKFADDETQLSHIQEFEDYYIPSNAIFWYTRDTFLYRMINQALRYVDIDTLYKLRYFVKDLHSQLTEQYELQQKSASVDRSLPSTVYRGQLMDNNEFNDKIRYNTGGFFSVSSFFSTTPFKHLADVYAGGGNNTSQSDAQHVLFYIDIDNSVTKFSYADISKKSVFEEAESEILFTMGSVYRILSVTLDSTDTWNVKLKLTDDNDEELKVLTEHMTENIITRYPLVNLAMLMTKMGYYDKAEKYHLLLFEDHSFIDNIQIQVAVYNNLGLIYNYLNQKTKSKENSEKAIEILLEHLSETKPEQLQAAYNNIGESYRVQGDFETALTYYNKALNVAIENTESNQIEIATIYNNIAIIYAMQCRRHESLEIFEKILSILIKVLPSNHPQIASTYNNIVPIIMELHENVRAAEYLNSILQIQKNSLPHDHPIFAITFNQLGMICHTQDKFKEALDWYNKAIQVLTKHVPVNHPDYAIFYNNIATVYAVQCQHAEAIEYSNKALQLQINSLLPNNPNVASTYYNLYLAYEAKDESKTALEMLEKSTEIYTKILVDNRNELAKFFNNVSSIYYKHEQFDKQIEYLNKALEIYLNSRSINYAELVILYNNLGTALIRLGKYQESLELSQESLDIVSKHLAENDINLAQTYNNIAQAHSGLNDDDTAVEYIKKTLSIQQIALPENSTDLANTYERLGNQYCKQGKRNEALNAFEKSLEINLLCLPHTHPNVANSYTHVAGVYYDQSRYDQQRDYLNKALEIYLNSQPLNYIEIAIIYNDYGSGLAQEKKFQESLDMLEKALELRIQYLPSNHLDIAISYNNTAQTLDALGNYSKTVDYYKKAISIQLKTVTSNNEDLAKTYNRLGATYYRQGKLNDALNSFEKSFEIIANNGKCSRLFHTMLLDNISGIQTLLADCDAQIDYLNKTLKIQMNSLPSDHPDLAAIYYHLADAFFKQKNFKQSLENIRKKHDIDSKNISQDDEQIHLNVNTIAILEILLWQPNT